MSAALGDWWFVYRGGELKNWRPKLSCLTLLVPWPIQHLQQMWHSSQRALVLFYRPFVLQYCCCIQMYLEYLICLSSHVSLVQKISHLLILWRRSQCIEDPGQPNNFNLTQQILEGYYTLLLRLKWFVFGAYPVAIGVVFYVYFH